MRQSLAHNIREVDARLAHYTKDIKALKDMRRSATLRQTYKACLDWLGKPELLQAVKGRLEYADVFPLVYLKMRREGLENPYRDIKPLLIDEMQDYTPVQYAVLARLFTCRKTVPGVTESACAPPVDRNLLYVACTRAMHGLVLTLTGRPSRFLPSTEEVFPM